MTANCTLNENSSHKNRDELAAFENDLGWIVQITHGSIGQAHCCHSEEGQEQVHFQWYSDQITEISVNWFFSTYLAILLS